MHIEKKWILQIKFYFTSGILDLNYFSQIIYYKIPLNTLQRL